MVSSRHGPSNNTDDFQDESAPSPPQRSANDEERGSLTRNAAPEPATAKIQIETTNRPRSGAMLMGMTKPALGIAGLLLLGTGAFAALGWFKIPGLNQQIEELKAEVDRLETQVDRLTEQNDRYESLNNQLNRTVDELELATDQLNTTVTNLEQVYEQLNSTKNELADRVLDLEIENANYAQLNQDLNTTATQLAQDVVFFEAALQKLIFENDNLKNITEAFEALEAQFVNITAEQNQTLIELRDRLTDMAEENDRLEALNDDLTTIANFLNETSLEIDDSLQQVTDYLATQIVANQVLVMESIENTYRQRISNWDCDYRDVFRDEDFGQDFDLAITDMETVLEYVDGRVLTDMCLDVIDFGLYLTEEYEDSVTTFNLITTVLEYTDLALEYYFPSDGVGTGGGPSSQDWADAAYQCENLPNHFATVDSTITLRRVLHTV